jgi:hypothetical protein
MARQPAEMSRRSALKASVGLAAFAGIGGLEAVATTGTAHADPTSPAAASPAADLSFLIDCDTWGARPPSSPLVMRVGTTRKIVVHHTAYPNTTDYSRDQAIWLAKDIQNLHMDHNGWSDTGQHFTVSRGGYVTEGRHRSLEGLTLGTEQVQSAHCVGENTQSIGIENEGTYITETPTPMLWASLVRLCVAICKQYKIHAHNMFGHWDYNNTDCPGIAFYREFPRLRLEVAALLRQDYSQIPARTWPDVFSSNAGPVVAVLQYLLVNQGYTLPTDGIAFTAATIAAVQDWQTKHGFIVASDGTATDPTWETLGVPLRKGDDGPAVSGLQSILAHKGYEVAVSGTFDQDTHKAVQKMQVLHGLLPTGKVDTNTWCATVGGIVAAEFRILKYLHS